MTLLEKTDDLLEINSTKKETQLVKNESFLSKIDHILVGNFVIERRLMRYMSLIVLMSAIIIGFATYVKGGIFWDTEISIRPNMVSTLAAVLLVSALYVRRLLEWSASVNCFLSLFLNITVTAILVQALLGGGNLMGLAMPYIVVCAIVLTWAGIRPLAPLVWGLVVVLGLVNLQIVSDAMGLWGYLFIILTAVGVFLQLQPRAEQFLPELRYEFTGTPPSLLDSRARSASENGEG